jgi:hypothetical protein
MSGATRYGKATSNAQLEGPASSSIWIFWWHHRSSIEPLAVENLDDFLRFRGPDRQFSRHGLHFTRLLAVLGSRMTENGIFYGLDLHCWKTNNPSFHHWIDTQMHTFHCYSLYQSTGNDNNMILYLKTRDSRSFSRFSQTFTVIRNTVVRRFRAFFAFIRHSYSRQRWST